MFPTSKPRLLHAPFIELSSVATFRSGFRSSSSAPEIFQSADIPLRGADGSIGHGDLLVITLNIQGMKYIPKIAFLVRLLWS